MPFGWRNNFVLPFILCTSIRLMKRRQCRAQDISCCRSAEAIERLNEELTGIHRKHVPTFRPENCHIRGGRPYEEIVRVAREIGADLIVLSTRGHSGLKHLLLGSTAERVVRNAPCPVLVARKRKQNRKQLAKHSLSAPFWFRQISRNVRSPERNTPRFWQRNLNATLRLFHAMYPYTNYVFVDRAGVRLSGLAEAVEETARQEMDALKQMDFLRGLPRSNRTSARPRGRRNLRRSWRPRG